MNEYTPDQLEFVTKLERLASYAGKEPDDEFRDLIAEIQDEFENLKRAEAREDESVDSRLSVGDIYGFATGISEDYPRAADGCRLFVAIWEQEHRDSAANN